MLFKEIQNMITHKTKKNAKTKNTNYSTYIDVVLIVRSQEIVSWMPENRKTEYRYQTPSSRRCRYSIDEIQLQSP